MSVDDRISISGTSVTLLLSVVWGFFSSLRAAAMQESREMQLSRSVTAGVLASALGEKGSHKHSNHNRKNKNSS